MRWTLPAMFLVACAGGDAVTACEDYVAAEYACATEALGEAPDDRAADELGGGLTCEGAYGELKGKAARGAVRLHTCYAETLDAADCSTPSAYDAAIVALADCEGAPQPAAE